MRTAMNLTLMLTAAMAVVGCSKDDAAKGGAASASAEPSMAPSAAMAPPSSASAPAPSAIVAEPPLAPRSDCPKGSSGPGTFDKPCEAKGNARLMEATWTGKSDDKGAPQFKVTNKSSLVILYGKIDVYFYDKAGKQLEVKDADGKGHPYRTCAGSSLFGGVMKAGEKAVLSFSCVKKENVPDGATAMEGELQMVGFADATEKKSEFYWKNDDLVPEVRKKGGAK